jgi:hypothetical protein
LFFFPAVPSCHFCRVGRPAFGSLFRVEGGHKLLQPPITFSPGDMVCVRTCNSRVVRAPLLAGKALLCNLGEDGCNITVALESRHGDATFTTTAGERRERGRE